MDANVLFRLTTVVIDDPAPLPRMQNIIRNGIRNTREKTKVEVTLERTGRRGQPQVAIRIRDHGPGVPHAELASIVQPYHTIRGRDPKKGTGLGLSIAARTIQQHGGRLGIVSADGELQVENMLPGAESDVSVVSRPPMAKPFAENLLCIHGDCASTGKRAAKIRISCNQRAHTCISEDIAKARERIV